MTDQKQCILTGHAGIDLYRAARTGDDHVVERFIQAFADDNGGTGAFLRTERAVRGGFRTLGGIRPRIVDQNAGVHSICWGFRSAVLWGRLDVLQHLLGHDPEALCRTDARDRTLMDHALEAGHLEIADWLISHGFEMGRYEDTFARSAMLSRKPRVIEYACSRGASVDGESGKRTALHHECNHGWSKLVPCL